MLEYVRQHPGLPLHTIQAAFPETESGVVTSTLAMLRSERGSIERRDGKHYIVPKAAKLVTLRPCISQCGRMVKSEHAGHRMCDHCRTKASDGLADHTFASGRRVRAGQS